MKPHIHRWRVSVGASIDYRRCDCGRWGRWVSAGKGTEGQIDVRVYQSGGAQERKLERKHVRARDAEAGAGRAPEPKEPA